MTETDEYRRGVADAAKVCADAAARLLSNGKARVNQVDRHTAEVLRGMERRILALPQSAPPKPRGIVPDWSAILRSWAKWGLYGGEPPDRTDYEQIAAEIDRLRSALGRIAIIDRYTPDGAEPAHILMMRLVRESL